MSNRGEKVRESGGMTTGVAPPAAPTAAVMRGAMDRLVLATLPPILAVLSLWFAVWATMEWLTPPDTARGARIAFSLTLSAVFAIGVARLRRPLPAALSAHAVFFVVMLLLAAKNIHAIALLGEVTRSDILFIVVVVAGFLSLDTRWLVAGIVVAFAAWIPVALHVTGGDIPQRLVSSALVSIIAAMVAHFARVHVYSRSEQLRLENEAQRARLADAIEQARHEIDERIRAVNALREAHLKLEEMVAQRTAQLRRTNTDLTREIQQRVELEGLREHALTQLSLKNAELERFAYTVSHDLKAPLVTIQGFAGMLREDFDAGDRTDFESDLNRIQNAAKSMMQLLDDVLKLSRSGRVVGDPVTVPLGAVVEEARGLIESPLRDAGGVITVAPNLPSVRGDRGRLLEVFVNLLDNAVKFRRDGVAPVVEVGMTTVDGEQRVFVRDNGRGIAPSAQHKAFAVFEKLDPDLPGSGVGLALVQRIVEVHGGRIWIEPASGEGTTVSFVLPWVAAQTDTESTPALRPAVGDETV